MNGAHVRVSKMSVRVGVRARALVSKCA